MQAREAINEGACLMRSQARLPAAASAAAALAIPTATAATRPLRFRARFVHVQRSTPELGSVQSGDRALSFLCVRHLYKSKST
jgi:hypothetical protein